MTDVLIGLGIIAAAGVVLLSVASLLIDMRAGVRARKDPPHAYWQMRAARDEEWERLIHAVEGDG